jgi:hypothetical protein
VYVLYFPIIYLFIYLFPFLQLFPPSSIVAQVIIDFIVAYPTTMVEMTIAQPNNTVYASNIDWSVKKPLLRRALYTLFTRHGKVSFHNHTRLCAVRNGS